MVSVWEHAAESIGAVCRHAGDAAVVSRTAVVSRAEVVLITDAAPGAGDPAREVLNRRTVEDPAPSADGRPGLRRDVHLVGPHVLRRPDGEDVAVGDEIGERVLLLVDLGVEIFDSSVHVLVVGS